ncbi:hypothetical protein [Alkalicoccobacillus plakortidis]|uniref:Uncharacterized protein n=1 Tax=Alkalicoccobacillus plakortidis TaxID=444060 RepID=A0ABT0XGA3_9BACI|nr:hypothetical protein [Alkalicoccobacillus plakortidis]MCM2674930.1 hypothetical protein [Alkalicoccobacillus plakortidis]
MKTVLILIGILMNLIVLNYQLDSYMLFLFVGILFGIYKGNKVGANLKKIFNLYRINFANINNKRISEFLSALLFALSTDILTIQRFLVNQVNSENLFSITIVILYSTVFGLILYRFLFMNILQEESRNIREVKV